MHFLCSALLSIELHRVGTLGFCTFGMKCSCSLIICCCFLLVVIFSQMLSSGIHSERTIRLRFFSRFHGRSKTFRSFLFEITQVFMCYHILNENSPSFLLLTNRYILNTIHTLASFCVERLHKKFRLSRNLLLSC